LAVRSLVIDWRASFLDSLYRLLETERTVAQEKYKSKTTVIILEGHEIGMPPKRRNLEGASDVTGEKETGEGNTLPLLIDRKQMTMEFAMNANCADR
jgi:hypothetical protein